MDSLPKLVLVTSNELEQLIRKVLSENRQASPQAHQQAAHEYLNITQAADYLQLPQSTLYQFCSLRRIPYAKRGKRNFFLRSDLDKWHDENRKKTKKEIEAEATLILKKGGNKL